jgi:hypothetical protein
MTKLKATSAAATFQCFANKSTKKNKFFPTFSIGVCQLDKTIAVEAESCVTFGQKPIYFRQLMQRIKKILVVQWGQHF